MATTGARRNKKPQTQTVKDSVRSASDVMNAAVEAIGRGLGVAAGMADGMIDRGRQMAGLSMPRRVRTARRAASSAAAHATRSMNKAARATNKTARTIANAPLASAREGARRTSSAATGAARSVAAAASARRAHPKKAGKKR